MRNHHNFRLAPPRPTRLATPLFNHNQNPISTQENSPRITWTTSPVVPRDLLVHQETNMFFGWHLSCSNSPSCAYLSAVQIVDTSIDPPEKSNLN